jgi:WD40 repeat protein
LVVELIGHSDEITYVTYSKDGKYILTASDDATARVWSAPASVNFEIDEPTISAIPNYHRGDCPVTIRFFVKITALNGSGTVVYRFKDSDKRIWPWRDLTFDEPGPKYVNWYWRITGDYTGSESIEILEPKGIKEQKAKFTVKCGISASPSPEPTSTPVPTPTPS